MIAPFADVYVVRAGGDASGTTPGSRQFEPQCHWPSGAAFFAWTMAL